MAKLKCWKLQGRYTPSRSLKWREKDKEEPRVVLVANTFVGDRKPSVDIWHEIKKRPPTPYIVSNKKFNTKSQAIIFARKWMKKHDKC